MICINPMTKSKLVLLFIIAITIVHSWDYLMFVQLWPSSWLFHDHNTEYNFTNDYFSIHGLWPQYWNDSYPENCGSHFNITIIKPIYDDLKIHWTDFKNPANFLKHEYLKHLTCINETDLDGDYRYFWYGLQLRESLDLYNLFKKNQIVPSNEYNYTLQSMKDAVKAVYNVNTTIICDNYGILEEIRFCMDHEMNFIDCPDNEMQEECQKGEISYYVYT
jgi:ribonuclease I